VTGPVPDDRPESARERQQEPEANAPARPELPAWATRPRTSDPVTDERLAAFVGRNWEQCYRRKFAPFREDPSFVPTWNWSAFFALEYWFLYRKLYLAFAVFFLVPGFVLRWLTGSTEQLNMETLADPANQSLAMMIVAVRLSAGLAAGGTANWLLFRRARAAAFVIQQQRFPEPEALALLARVGGVNRGGTTLFLVVSVVLMLLQFRG
jgi:hypothetical protein